MYTRIITLCLPLFVFLPGCLWDRVLGLREHRVNTDKMSHFAFPWAICDNVCFLVASAKTKPKPQLCKTFEFFFHVRGDRWYLQIVFKLYFPCEDEHFFKRFKTAFRFFSDMSVTCSCVISYPETSWLRATHINDLTASVNQSFENNLAGSSALRPFTELRPTRQPGHCCHRKAQCGIRLRAYLRCCWQDSLLAPRKLLAFVFRSLPDRPLSTAAQTMAADFIRAKKGEGKRECRQDASHGLLSQANPGSLDPIAFATVHSLEVAGSSSPSRGEDQGHKYEEGGKSLESVSQTPTTKLLMFLAHSSTELLIFLMLRRS